MNADINPFRPRRLKIVEAGWAGYNGTFGNVEFLDGVSVHPVPWLEQQRLGGIIRMESAEESEDAAQVGPAAELVRARGMSADEDRAKGNDTVVIIDGEAKLTGAYFTRDELEKVADDKGITGLRTIAVTVGAKGRSINELINEILERQQAPKQAGDDRE